MVAQDLTRSLGYDDLLSLLLFFFYPHYFWQNSFKFLPKSHCSNLIAPIWHHTIILCYYILFSYFVSCCFLHRYPPSSPSDHPKYLQVQSRTHSCNSDSSLSTTSLFLKIFGVLNLQISHVPASVISYNPPDSHLALPNHHSHPKIKSDLSHASDFVLLRLRRPTFHKKTVYSRETIAYQKVARREGIYLHIFQVIPLFLQGLEHGIVYPPSHLQDQDLVLQRLPQRFPLLRRQWLRRFRMR